MRPRRTNVTDLQPSSQLPRRSFLASLTALLAGAAVLGRARSARAAPQAIDPFLGEIAMVGFNFAPTGWALCNGQLLSIAQNTALFALLGTTYGGDGQVTFALPDLRGRVPMHMGQGPGTELHDLGERGGAEAITLTTQEIPSHSHSAMADAANGSSDTPTGRLVARNAAGVPQYGMPATPVALSPGAIAPAGGGQPHSNLQPYGVINFIIALQGIFPSRP